MAGQSEKVKNWLEKELETSSHGKKLPKDSYIASILGVSEKTVKRVMSLYKNKDLVCRGKGFGTYVSSENEKFRNNFLYSESSKNIADILQDMLNEGKFKTGTAMPSLKEVSITFKISKTTAIKAYRILADRGRIYKTGKTFWVGSPFQKKVQRKLEVWVFYKSEKILETKFASGKLKPLYLKMRDELFLNGFIMRFEKLNSFNGFSEKWLKSGSFPPGILFLSLEKRQAMKIKSSLELIKNRQKKTHSYVPKIVADWKRGDFLQIPCTHIQEGHLTTAAAKTAAQFIKEKKFSSIAFFGSKKDRIWDAGWIGVLLKIFTEADGLGLDLRFSLNIIGNSDLDSNYSAALEKIKYHYEESVWINKYRKQNLSELLSMVKTPRNLFAGFQENRDADLWLFTRDNEAKRAVRWAGSNGISLPEKLSVVSFENNPKYIKENISSCVPDFETTGYLLAHALINDFSVAKTSRGLIKTKAIMFERLT
ncbi:MAG: GntR family transcriptional regulator [Fibrobacterota bacterium]